MLLSMYYSYVNTYKLILLHVETYGGGTIGIQTIT